MIRHAVIAALGAVLALAIGAAGAYFTTQVQVPDSIIRAGTISVSSEPTSAPLSIDALAPGGSVARSMTVVNDGSLPMDVTLVASKKAGITEFYDALTARVTCGGIELWNGSLSQMRTNPLRLAPGSRGEVRFDIGLPSTVPNSVMGDYAKVSIYLDGEQVR